jgi:hypothetical protein
MARRSAYTKVSKKNFSRAAHVSGMGDVVWREFQCLNTDCTNQIITREDQINPDFEIVCDRCGYKHQAGEVKTIYDYELIDQRDSSVIEEGQFNILHDDYVAESARLKYCIICGTLKPLDRFDRHSARNSGRQGECNLCKQVYNGIKNQTRIAEQHREASQKRRLYTQFDNLGKLDIDAIYARFGGRCFKCNTDLSADLADKNAAKLGNLDHTLPVFYLWPLTVDNATLLCRLHNGEKAEKWPGVFYNDAELRKLSALTGIDYRTLRGDPVFNHEAIEKLKEAAFVEALFEKFAAYPEELLRLRNRILGATGFDFLGSSAKLSKTWRARADALR